MSPDAHRFRIARPMPGTNGEFECDFHREVTHSLDFGVPPAGLFQVGDVQAGSLPECEECLVFCEGFGRILQGCAEPKKREIGSVHAPL